MKKTLITAVALAACAGTQLFAQNAKQGVITFALTGQAQSSVSDTTANNQGGWNSPAVTGKAYYKTTSTKVATLNILQAIAIVLHNNAGFYSSKAQLVLVQPELSGFFNLTDELAQVGDPNTIPPGGPTTIQSDHHLAGRPTCIAPGQSAVSWRRPRERKPGGGQSRCKPGEYPGDDVIRLPDVARKCPSKPPATAWHNRRSSGSRLGEAL
jgi:hypothetical protein